MKRGDIVLMVAPGELGKPRPALIVQADELGDATTSLILCPLSSDVREGSNIRPVIEPSAENGLRLRSQVMADKIVALPRRRVRQAIGRLDDASRDAVDQALLVALGLAR